MKIIIFTVLVLIVTYSCKYNNSLTSPSIEANEKPAKIDTIHGHILTDNYFWLRDKDNRDVIRFLKKENRLTSTYMKSTDSIQRILFNEILALEDEYFESLPYEKNGYWYQIKTVKGEDFPISIRWKNGDESNKKVFFDENELLKRMGVEEVTKEAMSKDNRYLAFSSDKTGSGELDMHILDLETNEVLDDVLLKGWEILWLNDNKTLYYTKDDSITNRTYRLYKHIVGQPQSKDLLIYEEKDETFSLNISKSRSGSYIFLNSFSKDENQIWYLDIDKPNDKPILIKKMEPKVNYSIGHFSGYFYMLTNENASNYKINRTAHLKNGVPTDWKAFIPENKTIYIENFLLFENYLIIEEKVKGLTQFHVFDQLAGDDYYIPVSEDSYLMEFSFNMEPNSNTFRYTVESFSKPLTVYDWNFLTRESSVKKTTTPKNYVEENYNTELVWARATDGTEVPISIVYKKETFSKDGTNPLLIEAYGAFGATYNAEFDNWLFPLLDRGFIYARPHIRGGGYLGIEWYKEGKYLKKKNTFTDFIDCTEYLIKEGYASKDLIVARGASAGGLLMGAVANMRPELYHTMLIEVPFLDVINTMMDATIPLTVPEYKEWGNPNDKEYFEYMLSYSPYDNIWATSYPNMLFSAGYLDENAPYWEAAKTVAKIKEISTGKNLLFLKTNMKDGHQGPSGLYPEIEEEAYFQSFILKTVFPEKYN